MTPTTQEVALALLELAATEILFERANAKHREAFDKFRGDVTRPDMKEYAQDLDRAREAREDARDRIISLQMRRDR